MILTDLLVNESSRIIEFFDLENSIVHQLLDSGLLPGREISLVMKNENQNKVILDLDGIFLSIRFDSARHIIVQ